MTTDNIKTAEYELVLGMEIHMHLKLNTKVFCRCSAEMYGAIPNSHVCPVCLGLPGALPVPNKKAIEYAQLLGLALDSKLSKTSKFDRKNYFYPDLSKGYQISQYDQPFSYDGKLKIADKVFRVTRVHLEEDTGKSLHEHGKTLLDFNKAGMPLVEIVTEPDFRKAEEAVEFGKEIQRIVRYLKISEADMEKGQLRLEANISLRKPGDLELPKYKVEVKNINSFRFLEKAVNYEIKRQSEILTRGETPQQENRGWDDVKQVTVSQRDKEEAHDYRYFPEPDIPPMEFSDDYITHLKGRLCELPFEKRERFLREFGLSKEVVTILCDTPEISEKFEECAKSVDPKTVANLIVNKPQYREMSVADIIKAVETEKSKVILGDDALIAIVKDVVLGNPKAVEDYKAGKTTAIAFLVGQSMKAAKGQGDAVKLKSLIEEELTKAKN